MPALFKSLSELLEKIETTKKRLVIIDQTANYLKTLSPQEIESAINMMVGRAFPKYNQKTLDVSWSTLTRILERISEFDWNLFRDAMASTGDIGSATKNVLEQSKAKKANPTNPKIPKHNRSHTRIRSHSPSTRLRLKNQKRTPHNRPLKPSHTSRNQVPGQNLPPAKCAQDSTKA